MKIARIVLWEGVSFLKLIAIYKIVRAYSKR
jgi:hypothetical protein